MKILGIQISAGFGKTTFKAIGEGFQQWVIEEDTVKEILKKVLEEQGKEVLKPGQKIYRLEV